MMVLFGFRMELKQKKAKKYHSIMHGNLQIQNLAFSPRQVNALFEEMADKIEEMSNLGIRPAILISPQIRRAVRKFVESVFPNVFVISYSELTPDTELKSVGVVRYPDEN